MDSQHLTLGFSCNFGTLINVIQTLNQINNKSFNLSLFVQAYSVHLFIILALTCFIVRQVVNTIKHVLCVSFMWFLFMPLILCWFNDSYDELTIPRCFSGEFLLHLYWNYFLHSDFFLLYMQYGIFFTSHKEVIIDLWEIVCLTFFL